MPFGSLTIQSIITNNCFTIFRVIFSSVYNIVAEYTHAATHSKAKNTIVFALFLLLSFLGNISIFSVIYAAHSQYHWMPFFGVYLSVPFDSVNSRPFHMHKHKCATNRITTHIRWILFKNLSRVSLCYLRYHLCIVRWLQVKVGVNLNF